MSIAANSFAAKLRRLRGKRTLRQAAAAISPLLPRKTYANWECGKRVPPAWMHGLIFDALEADWSAVDWSKSTKQIAEEQGKGLEIVSKMRRRFAPATLAFSLRRGVRAGRDWSAVDWSKSTKQIAEEQGASMPLVSQARRLWAPETLQRAPRSYDR